MTLYVWLGLWGLARAAILVPEPRDAGSWPCASW